MIKEKKTIFRSIIATLVGIIVGLSFTFSKDYWGWSVLFFVFSFFTRVWILVSILNYADYKIQLCPKCKKIGIETSRVDDPGPDIGGILEFRHHHKVTITYRCEACGIVWEKKEEYTEASDSSSR